MPIQSLYGEGNACEMVAMRHAAYCTFWASDKMMFPARNSCVRARRWCARLGSHPRWPIYYSVESLPTKKCTIHRVFMFKTDISLSTHKHIDYIYNLKLTIAVRPTTASGRCGVATQRGRILRKHARYCHTHIRPAVAGDSLAPTPGVRNPTWEWLFGCGSTVFCASCLLTELPKERSGTAIALWVTL